MHKTLLFFIIFTLALSVMSILIAIATGLISGIISVLCWEGLRYLVDRFRYRKLYRRYEGQYLAFNKWEKESPDQVPVKYFKITREGNKFMVEGSGSPEGPYTIYGEIIMDRQMPNYGKGYYQHHYITGERARYGFWEIQLSDGYILAHEIIFDKNPNSNGPNHRSQQHTDGYRWVKKP